MRRRGVMALAALPLRVGAEAVGFPDAIALDGAWLIRNGIAERRYLGMLVYRAALYLTAPSRDAQAILDAATPRLLRLNYARAVPAETARGAWRDSYAANGRGAAPPALLGWVRDVVAGNVEDYVFLADHARLAGSGRAQAVLAGAPAARDLLACWLGPAPPTEALKRGLLGLASDRAAAIAHPV